MVAMASREGTNGKGLEGRLRPRGQRWRRGPQGSEELMASRNSMDEGIRGDERETSSVAASGEVREI